MLTAFPVHSENRRTATRRDRAGNRSIGPVICDDAEMFGFADVIPRRPAARPSQSQQCCETALAEQRYATTPLSIPITRKPMAFTEKQESDLFSPGSGHRLYAARARSSRQPFARDITLRAGCGNGVGLGLVSD